MTRPSIRGGVALAVGISVLAMDACSPQSTGPPAVERDTIRALNIVEGKQDELTHHGGAYHGGIHVYRVGDSVVEDSRYVHETVNEGS